MTHYRAVLLDDQGRAFAALHERSQRKATATNAARRYTEAARSPRPVLLQVDYEATYIWSTDSNEWHPVPTDCDYCGRNESGHGHGGRYCYRHADKGEGSSMTIEEREQATRNAMACRCQSDPYTWIVDDPIDGMVICFGCRTCGVAWTRIAPEPMQRMHKRTLKRKAAAELVRLGYPA